MATPSGDIHQQSAHQLLLWLKAYVETQFLITEAGSRWETDAKQAHAVISELLQRQITPTACFICGSMRA